MNRMKRSIALLTAILLCALMLPPAYAATGDVTVYPGDERAVVYFTIEDIYSLDGSFSVDDADGIVSSWSVRVSNRGGMNGGSVNGNVCYLYETANPARARNVVLEVTLKLKKTAAAGDAAQVTFDYIKGIEDSGMQIKDVSESAKVSVVVVQKDDDDAVTPSTDPTSPTNTTQPDDTRETTAPADPSTPTTATEPNITQPDDRDDPTNPTKPTTPTEPTSATNPASPTNPTVNTGGDDKPVNNSSKPVTNNGANTTGKNNTTTTTAPDSDDGTINYEALQKQINIAEGLTEADYEPEVWAELQELLEKAKDALDSKDQDEVDDLAEQLAKMNQDLAGLDTSRLVAAMDKVTEKSADTALSSLWYQMHDLLNNAQSILDMGSEAAQSDVDDMASRIEAVLAEIEKESQTSTAEPGTMVEEVPIEVAPEDDYCNIGLHKLWPILFFVSLALNIAFAVIIIIYLVRKKRNQKDDTPLVDYDIDDDLDDLDELDDELEAVE